MNLNQNIEGVLPAKLDEDYPFPETSEQLIERLDEAYPPPCLGKDEDVIAHHRYAAKRELIDELKQALLEYKKVTMRIRKMTSNDVPIVIALGHAMHEESYFKFLDFNEDKLQRLWQNIEDMPTMFCAFVAESNTEFIGFFVGMCTEHWFGHDKVACDLAVYVHDKRGVRGAPRLIKAYEEWAWNVANAQEVHIGTSTNVNSERVKSLYND